MKSLKIQRFYIVVVCAMLLIGIISTAVQLPQLKRRQERSRQRVMQVLRRLKAEQSPADSPQGPNER